MKFDWRRLILQILATIAGGMGFLNLGRLTVPDVGAGPMDLAGWVGLPALASLAGLVGQHYLRSPAAPDKPGCAGHLEFCKTLYKLAMDGQWQRAKAAIEAWEKTIATEPKP